MVRATTLLFALLPPTALALKSNFAAERLETGFESDQPVQLGITNATAPLDLNAEDEAMREAVEDFLLPQLNRSIPVLSKSYKKTFAELHYTLDLNETCIMSGPERCHMSSFRKGVPTLVFPGGATRCIFGDDYAFSVVPGDMDKLLIFFEGGGACWDEATTLYQPACKTVPMATPFLGPLNNCPGGNPFRHHTVIYVQACSGDLHSGNTERPWKNPLKPGFSVAQRGFANTRAVIDWAKANVARKLSNLALSGESAGAIGVQMWSRTLLSEFSYDKAAVLSDSYVGVFPRGFQGPVFKALGACEVGLFSAEVTQWCRLGDTSIEEVFSDTIKHYRNVAFGHVVSKHDLGQMAFYDIARETQQLQKVQRFCAKQGVPFSKKCNLTGAPPEVTLKPKLIDFSDFHKKMSVVINRFSLEPNYVSYVMTGAMHTVVPFVYGNCSEVDYSHCSIDGWLKGVNGPQRKSVQEWVEAFFLSPEGAPLQSRCEHLSSDSDDWCIPEQRDKKLTVTRLRS